MDPCMRSVGTAERPEGFGGDCLDSPNIQWQHGTLAMARAKAGESAPELQEANCLSLTVAGQTKGWRLGL